MTDWTSHEIEIREDLAIHRYSGGAYIKPRTGSHTVESGRKYLNLLRKNETAEWKVYLHSLNSNI